MKFLHAADIHACRERWAECAASLDTLAEAGRREGVDLFTLSGDLAHGPLQDSERDIFDALCGRIQALANLAPVALIEGTPSHDAPGSLEVFERLQVQHSITILRPGKAYFLDDCAIHETRDADPCGPSKAILFGIPEPQKKWLLAEAGATGKDDSDGQVRDAMRSLCLGLGALRREHSDLPCVALYHGEIVGAKSATGYGAEAGTGIAITRDALSAIGADYYALGHIHEPQQVDDLPAYYAGSAYAITWGETHKPGANLVEIDGDANGWARAITRVPFPHPQRIKLARTWDDADPLFAEVYAGKQAWLEVTASRAESADLNPEGILAHLIEEGALPGSRVTLNILPTETVRAGEIVDKKRLRDKVLVYSEASETPMPESVLTKADEIERESAGAGGAGQGAQIRIDRLRLRGAIGIWKKSRKDEIDLDLESLGAGVLALVGPNGHGKTTILENMHPWPCMLTRDGALKDHFRLKDSCRDLYFTDLRTGWKYRALITIRADILSGAAEYFLSVDKGTGFEPYPGINGRKEPYEAAIGQLFGSLEMYLQTAFVTQRPNKYAPDLGQATQGQRKTLFAELAGIDYLAGYAATCKARGDEIEGSLRVLQGTIAAAADVDDAIARAHAEIAEAAEARGGAEKDVADAIARVDRLNEERTGLVDQIAEIDLRAMRYSQLEREIAELTREVARVEAEIGGFQIAAAGRGAAEAALAQLVSLETEAAILREEKAQIDEGNRKAQAEHQERYITATNSRGRAQMELDGKRKTLSRSEQVLAVARARLAAPVADTCPTCGQKLPADRLEALAHAHQEAEAEIGRLAASLSEAENAVSAAEDALGAIVQPAAPSPAPFPCAARLAELGDTIEFMDRASLETTLVKAREADVRIEEGLRRLKDANERQADRVLEQASRAPRPEDAGIRAALEEKDAEIARERERYTEARAAAEAAKARGSAAERALADAERRRAAREEAKTKLDIGVAELADWRLLERAVGANGIQALELDALAPSIAAVSNKLLGEAYGSRYQIEFRTTRIAGKGSKTKQVEDFEIYILDTETGDEQTIDSLSGGEAVWIRKALYDGFAIIRARNTGTQFATVFLDEADGALDPEARMLYLRMLDAAHRESGRYQTIIVTHSKELQAMVERTIDVAQLGPREAKVEGGIAA